MATFAKIASPSEGLSDPDRRTSWTENKLGHCDLEVSRCLEDTKMARG